MGGQGDRMGHRGGYAAAVRGGGPSEGKDIALALLRLKFRSYTQFSFSFRKEIKDQLY